jgi:hypothetical protein
LEFLLRGINLDSFETIIKTIFEKQGYWVKTSFKVELTKEEKRKIDRPSTPRWELDVIAYKANVKEILVIECKSYLDSPGVKLADFKNGKWKNRYKLFNERKLREVVFNRLLLQLIQSGSCTKYSTVKLCLAAGKVASKTDREKISEHFKNKSWIFFSDEWIKNELINLSNTDYENEVSIVTTKILSRK